MKKILFVTMFLAGGGAEKSLVNLLNELPEDKYDIDLLLFKKEGLFLSQVPSYVNIIENRVLTKIYDKPYKSGFYGIIKIIGTFISKIFSHSGYEMREYRWRKFYKRFIPNIEVEYDVAVAFIAGEVTYFVCDKVKAKKKIAWVHTDYLNAKCDSERDRKYYLAYEKIIAVSDECKNIMKREFDDISDRIMSMPNITSSLVLRRRADDFYPAEYDKDSVIILSMGRLVPIKRFDAAIDAALILKKKGVEFKWFLIGKGEEEKQLRRKIERNNVSDCFVLLGLRENPYPYIKNATIVVQTSKYEGKSVVLDEAKILGIPIVSTNYDTVYDQLVNEEDGLIVGMNPNEVAIGVERVLFDEKLNSTIRNNLREREYGNQGEVERYIRLFDE